ncbi:follistatin-related protein 5-like [Xenia sp. Carnegie-2017]|uniref:follistatin-related protein 5-like n=1 Tax=Xenia sp. Carnegie-2017 TaxID=2897299 RepID=UPI001F039437|nr:follistatin-related protein 5-like [Xenia sp. Carnegie-2017]
MYDVHWYNEIWVHSWTLATFAVVKTDKRILTHKAVRAHTTPGFTHGDMLADEKLWEGQYGYVSHFRNDGIHKVNLVDKSYAGYVNLSAYNCTGTWRMGYSTYNQRVYVDCRQNRREMRTLEMDPTTDRVTRVFQFPGNPHVSPNGRFIVSVYNRNGVSTSTYSLCLDRTQRITLNFRSTRKARPM